MIEETSDYFIERDGVRYAGVHLIIDLWGGERLDDLAYVEATILDCVKATGATELHRFFHPFVPPGVTGFVALKESHISIHTWPKFGQAHVDIFMCGKAEPHKAVGVLYEAFRPRDFKVKELLRGQVLPVCPHIRCQL